MADALLGLCLFIAAGGACLVALIELRARRERRAGWQTVALRFGRDVTPEAVLAVLDRLAGLHRGAVVVLEARADHHGVRHYMSTDRATLATLRGGLRAVLPSLRLVPVDADEPAPSYRSGRSVRVRGHLRTLRVGGHDLSSAGLLAAMQPLGKGERLLLSWMIRPGRARAVPREVRGQTVPAEHGRLLRTKNGGAVLNVRGFVAADAASAPTASHLLGRLASVLRARSTAHGQLRLLPRSAGALARDLGRLSFVSSDRYAADELAGLLAWPIGAPALPGLSLGTSPLLIASDRLPRTGRVLGIATWPGGVRPIAQPVLGALSHSLIAGPTGVGKSTLLTNLLSADLARGRGAVLIDGKGDTAAALLARLPSGRLGDVIVLDCASADALPGLRLFGSVDAELAADVVLGVLGDLFRDSWGPLSERYLRAGLVAVAHDPEGTLADVPFVYSDATYRRRLMGQVSDPLTRSTLAAFEAMSAGERQQQLAAPLNKLGTLVGRPVVRTVLGQTAPQLDFRQVLDQRQVVVVSLAPARVGAPAARLIGALIVFALFQAVQARARLPERARAPFMAAIDEPRALGDLPMPLDALLEQARGLGVGVTLAPQSLAQLSKSVREAALTNVATRVVFRQHADDARLLARDLPGVTPEDLGDLAVYEAVARIGLGPGDVAAPVTIKTEPLGPTTTDPRALRAASAKRYGQTLAAVDAALQARHRAPATTAAGAVGRTRRRQA